MQHDIRPTIYYYNPNIWPREEYEIRKQESQRHAESLGLQWIDGDYDHRQWLHDICGLEQEPERGRRCEQCFRLRLMAAARTASERGFSCFATTLASSRWKNLEQVNRAGLAAQEAFPGVTFWAQNWRKGGLQERRNQLLKQYQFYNQQYCGCEFSAHSAQALTKPLLREQMRQAKRQHATLLPQYSHLIVDKLYALLNASFHPSPLLAYWPLSDEVDIRPLLDHLVAEGTTVLLPRVTGDTTMELRRYTSPSDLREGAFHILEPTGDLFTAYEQIAVALIPGMAFDAAGHRLGRGRGYYDRLLALMPHTHKVGVCFPFQRVANVPTESHDILMDGVIA